DHFLRDSLPALHRFEAPVIAPFAKSSARIKTNTFHPTVNHSKARLAVEIKYHVGVWDIELILDDDGIRVAQDSCSPQRIDGSFNKAVLVERFAARVSDLAQNRAASRRRIVCRILRRKAHPEERNRMIVEVNPMSWPDVVSRDPQIDAAYRGPH